MSMSSTFSLIVGFVVSGLQRHALCAEAVVFGYQLFRYCGVVNAPANLAGYEVGYCLVRFGVGQDVIEVALPDAEAGAGVQALPELVSLLLTHLEGVSGIDVVYEAGRCSGAMVEHLRVVRSDGFHLVRLYLGVVQGSAPLRSKLEDGEMPHILGDFLNCLHSGSARSDDRHSLVREVDGGWGQRDVWKDCPLKESIPAIFGRVGWDRMPTPVIKNLLLYALPSASRTSQLRESSS